MDSFEAIIRALGVSRLAAAFGVRESHVRTMLARRSVPPEYWGPLLAEAASQGQELDFAKLREMRAAKLKAEAASRSEAAA